MLEPLSDWRLKPKGNGSTVPSSGEGAHLRCRTRFAILSPFRETTGGGGNTQV